MQRLIFEGRPDWATKIDIPKELYPRFYGGVSHSYKTARIAATIAIIKKVSEEKIVVLKIAALVHDVGKNYVRDELIRKAGPLTLEELCEMRTHSPLSVGMIKKYASHLEWCNEVSEVVLHHHAHWDGNGYPTKKKGHEIPYLSRILAVADTLDALKAPRAYHGRFTQSERLTILSKMSGKVLDPSIVETRLALH